VLKRSVSALFVLRIFAAKGSSAFEYVARFNGLNLNHEICPFSVDGLSVGIFRFGGG
jgi:hypothetical protein